uniref:Uncharacterized protein n=2 Tax=viral metagenome TaxID=1070528 RepID=A0A6H1ZC34_9ZZZZ
MLRGIMSWIKRVRWLNYLIIWIAFCLLSAWFIDWWNEPCYVIAGKAEVASPEIKRAIYKMGPRYAYKLDDGKLYVNKGDKKWLRLRY